MNNQITIDIETEPDPSALAHPPEFSAPSNYKDPAKIESYKSQAYEEWKDRMALRATTGRILCAGVKSILTGVEIHEGNETDIVRSLVQVLDFVFLDGEILCGWNHSQFDLPFIYQRALILGVKIPERVFKPLERWNKWQFQIADGMQIWAAGTKEYASLGDVARVLGCGSKDDGISKNFGQVYHENREKALVHLRNDLEMTDAVIRRMMGC